MRAGHCCLPVSWHQLLLAVGIITMTAGLSTRSRSFAVLSAVVITTGPPLLAQGSPLYHKQLPVHFARKMHTAHATHCGGECVVGSCHSHAYCEKAQAKAELQIVRPQVSLLELHPAQVLQVKEARDSIQVCKGLNRCECAVIMCRCKGCCDSCASQNG